MGKEGKGVVCRCDLFTYLEAVLLIVPYFWTTQYGPFAHQGSRYPCCLSGKRFVSAKDRYKFGSLPVWDPPQHDVNTPLNDRVGHCEYCKWPNKRPGR